MTASWRTVATLPATPVGTQTQLEKSDPGLDLTTSVSVDRLYHVTWAETWMDAYRWLHGCCLRSGWRRSASAWPARSRRSRERGRAPPPAWWCWDPSGAWGAPRSGRSSSEPRTLPGTVRWGPAAGSASASETHRDRYLKPEWLLKWVSWCCWHVVLTLSGLRLSDVCVCVSPKAAVVVDLCFSAPCQVIRTPQSMFLFARRSAAASGDRPRLSSSACSHGFPSSGPTIKYQLHFRLIHIWEFRAHRAGQHSLHFQVCVATVVH